MSQSIDLTERVTLGHTGLMVSRLGIGSSYGVSQKACQNAFDQGVNYFFWGSARRLGMALAIRDLCPAHREELVVVLQCYVRIPGLVPRSIDQGLKTLKLDHADVLLLGWHDSPPSPAILNAAEQQRQKGKFRYLGISSHRRVLFSDFQQQNRYDLFHIRYNAAHPGAEQDIFPHLPQSGRPGIVAFTCTRWGDLLKPNKMPKGEAPLTAADCYRFALSSSQVDVAICGPKSDEEMAHGLTTLKAGPLSDEEMKRIRAIGHYVHDTKSIADWFR